MSLGKALLFSPVSPVRVWEAANCHQSVCQCLETVTLYGSDPIESFECLQCCQWVWLLVSWWMLSVNFCWVCSQPPVLFLSTGRCASCGENVVGEGTGCTAMDQVFHVDCFVCMTCSTKLRGKPFFAVEKKAYCEPCYIVSNFFPPLHLPHYDMRGGIIGSPVPGMFIYFHIRQPHLMSPKPGEPPPLTTPTSSFRLFVWLCFVFGHSMKLSWFLRLLVIYCL